MLGGMVHKMSNEVISKGTKTEQVKKLCEYCGEYEAEFSIEVNCTDGSVEESNLVCADCVATWFTETPESVERMSIVRLEANE